MNRGKANRVSKLFLGHRQLVSIFIGKAHRLHTAAQLAKEMGDSLTSLAAAHIHYPLTEDRRLDQCLHENRFADLGMGTREFLKLGPRDEGDITARQHLNIVIRYIEEQVLKIDGLARHMDSDYLPGPGCRDLLPIGKTRDEHAALCWRLTFSNNVGARLDGPQLVRKAKNRLTAVFG